MDNNPKQQATERLKQANNVLVTVSNNPSVDQLAACIGLTLLLNKIGKHATAVYSGATPSTIEFLKPEQTIEKNTDSLRDFIIALDKSKADKLRYKVEDKIVRIFITPYHTSLSEKDLAFSLGDLNVEVIVALGVHQQADLDQAIMAHGRILHDATVISINTTKTNNIGNINLQDPTASSLSELVAGLAAELGKDAKGTFDVQIATALLTGIVAETNRFSNNKTSAQTMSVSAQLITAGANQQLVATKLEQPPPPPPPPPPTPLAQTQPHPARPLPPAQLATTPPPKQNNDGTLVIDHNRQPQALTSSEEELVDPLHQIEIDQEGTLHALPPAGPKPVAPKPASPPSPGPSVTGGSPFISTPPSMGGTLTANSKPEASEPGIDPLSLPTPMPKDNNAPKPPASNSPLDVPAPASVSGPSLTLDSARTAVESAVLSNPAPSPGPSAAISLPALAGPSTPPPTLNVSKNSAGGVPPLAPTLPSAPTIQPRAVLDMPPPPAAALTPAYDNTEDAPSGAPAPSPSEADTGATAPPPVPPPMMPPVF